GNGSSAGKSDIFLACYDAQLERKWHIAAGNLETDEVTGLAQLPNGDIALSGAFWFSLPLGDTTLEAGSSVRSLFLARVRADGQLRWAQRFSGDGLKQIGDIRSTADGGLVMAGYFENDLQLGDSLLISAAEPGSTSLFVARFNGDGGLQWVQQAGNTGNTRVEAMALAPDGTIAVGGNFDGTFSLAGSALDAGFFDTDVFVAAFSADGTPLWARDAGGVVFDDLKALTVDSSGHIYITGDITGVMNVSDEIMIESSTGNSDVFLIKYDLSGTPIWGKAFGGQDVQTGNSIATAADRVVVGGSFQGPIAYDGLSATTGDMSTAWGYLTGFAIETGEGQWLQAIPTDDLGLVRALAFLPNRDLLAGGLFGSTAEFDGLQLTAAGGLSAFLGLRPAVITNTRTPSVPEHTFSIFPNPARDEVQLRPYHTGLQVQLLNAMGQPVSTPTEGGRLHLGHLPGGLYYLQVVDEEAGVQLLPLVVNR
ncbi:MAG: hypothetical protein GVY26_01845, partial [Bacteroidetes bacterium]|nr:hypothetical protein [Bacteroidota bacterium]